jgi:hypothetical protein
MFLFAQLRDVLAAKYSAVVSEKDHNSRPLLPQRTKPDLIAFRVGQDDRRQTLADRCGHEPHSRLEDRLSQKRPDRCRCHQHM